MQIDIHLGVRDAGTRATVTTRRLLFWRTVRTYECFSANPIRGGRWADCKTGEEVGAHLEGKLNHAAQAAVRRRR